MVHTVIVPLFKNGDRDILNNYRQISLLSVASKCYTTVSQNRLTKGMQQHANFPGNPLCEATKQHLGKIQWDGQKFLACFKSYFGPQISSQSLNEVHIYWYSRNPQQKVIFLLLLFCFCLWLSWIANGERSRLSGLVKQATAIKNHRKCMEKIAIWECWVVSTIVLTKLAPRKRSLLLGNYIKCQRATWAHSNWQSKKIWKKSPFVADFGCNWQIGISFNDCDDICDPK